MPKEKQSEISKFEILVNKRPACKTGQIRIKKCVLSGSAKLVLSFRIGKGEKSDALRFTNFSNSVRMYKQECLFLLFLLCAEKRKWQVCHRTKNGELF